MDALETLPRNALFPPRHPLAIPPYTQEGKHLQVLLDHLKERGPKDSLFRAWYTILGGNLQRLDLGLDDDLFLTLLGMELLAYTPEQVAHHIYQAYQKREQEDQQDFNEAQMHFLTRQFFARQEDDIPLFARIGPPQERFTPYDLPYLIVIPAHVSRMDDWAEVVIAERDTFGPPVLPPQAIIQYGEHIRRQYRETDGPRRLMWGKRDYWSYRINLLA
jgi:hypothetical protein